MAFIFSSEVNAQSPGDLDITFGTTGYTLANPVVNTSEYYWDIITLSDDKIVMAGYTQDKGDSDIIIAKFEANGSPDLSFAESGFAVIDLTVGGDEEARGVFELPDGELLVTGFKQFAQGYDGFIMRLRADGSIDDSFGTLNGHTTFNTGNNQLAYGRAIRTIDNEIFVGATAIVNGQSDLCVFNFTQNGILDVSFSTAGVAVMDIHGETDELFTMDITSNGSFILGGFAQHFDTREGVVAKLSQFGTPAVFGTDGAYSFHMGSVANEVFDLFVDADDKIVFVGNHGIAPNVDGFVKRLNADGTLDETFASGGTITSDPGATTSLFFRSVEETADGGIVAIGNTDGAVQEIYAMMLTSSGNLNSAFGGNGDAAVPSSVVTNTLVSVGGALQSNGAVIVGGHLRGGAFADENMFLLRLVPIASQTSITELSNQSVTVFPNPVTDRFSVEMENVNHVQLISMVGKVVASWNVQSSYTIPSNVSPGIYLLNIESDNGLGVARIVVN